MADIEKALYSGLWWKIRDAYNSGVEILLKEKLIGKKTELRVCLNVSPKIEENIVFSGIDEDWFGCSELFILRLTPEDIEWMGPRVKLLHAGEDFSLYYCILSKENDTMKYPYLMCPRCRKYKRECGSIIPQDGFTSKQDRDLCYRCDEVVNNSPHVF